jgi:hypothetical protein
LEHSLAAYHLHNWWNMLKQRAKGNAAHVFDARS